MFETRLFQVAKLTKGGCMAETKTKPRIEILTFDGCPNREPAIELVSRVTRERGVEADV